MVLLIPRRIKKLKDEGRAEGVQEGVEKGREEGRAQERELTDRILARYERGEITADQLYALLTFRDSIERNGG